MKLHITFIVLFSFFIGAGAFAQEKTFEISLGGGVGFPTSPDDFKDFWNMGFNGMAGIAIKISPQFLIGGNGSFNTFGINEDEFMKQSGVPSGSGVNIDGGAIEIFEVLGIAKYYFQPPTTPTNFYIIGGAGLANLKFKDATISGGGNSITVESENESDFMVVGGVGIKFSNIFIEGRYSLIFTEDNKTSFLPVRAGFIF